MDEKKDLKHYGVLGMKWGVRKDRSSGGRGFLGRSSTTKPKPRRLTNEQLRKKIERLRLEKELDTLSPKQSARGRTKILKMLANAGEKVATRMIEQGMEKGANYVISLLLKRLEKASERAG
jgi:hypothetical protein